MNSTWLPLTAVALAFAAAATLAAWRRQRRTIDRLRAQLARNEEARDQLAECLLQERRRVESALAAVQDDPKDRRALLERMLSTQPAPAEPEFPWLETMPSAEVPESVSRAHVDLSA